MIQQIICVNYFTEYNFGYIRYFISDYIIHYALDILLSLFEVHSVFYQ